MIYRTPLVVIRCGITSFKHPPGRVSRGYYARCDQVILSEILRLRKWIEHIVQSRYSKMTKARHSTLLEAMHIRLGILMRDEDMDREPDP